MCLLVMCYMSVSHVMCFLVTRHVPTCAGIKEVCGAVLRHGSLATAEQMVQYTYEPVEGDKVRTLDIIYPRYLVTVDI